MVIFKVNKTNLSTSSESAFLKASVYYERFPHPARTKPSGFTLRKKAAKLILGTGIHKTLRIFMLYFSVSAAVLCLFRITMAGIVIQSVINTNRTSSSAVL